MRLEPGANSRVAFNRVDDSADPDSLVEYLDSVDPAVRGYKRLTFDLLEVSEGDALLDVGCGTGEDVRALAKRVGPRGRAVGIDNSQTMIAQAQRRAEGLGLPVVHRLGDAHCLQFADEEFDRARADRVFQHLSDPRAALAELVRVTRAGGRIAITDPDWETFVVDCGDMSIGRRIKHLLCDSLPGGSTARRLPGLMRGLGLESVTVTPATLVLDRLDAAEAVLDLSRVADHARQVGVLSGDEHASWLADLRERDNANGFFAALTGFLVSADKPGRPARSPG